MTAPAIRDATAADVPAITAIYAHHVLHGRASFEEVPPDAAEIARRHREHVEKGLPYLVAIVDGAVGGYAYAGLYRPRSAYRFTCEDSIYVHQDLAGRGIGRALLGTLIARTEAMGFRQMVAVIGDSANAGSIGLHATMGFRHAGLLEAIGFKHGRWIDSVLMQRPLGTGTDPLPPPGAPGPLSPR
jgi:phosphinothricin acetyltransferase